MRRDFSIPVLLLVGLAAMVVYASSGNERGTESTALAASCENGEMLARIPELHEASGLARSRRTPDLFWSLNDSGDAVVYGIGPDGRVRARVRVTGATVFDWEAIATGPCPAGDCLYVADIGDNAGWRRDIVVYRMREPAPGEEATANAEAFRGAYPDGAQDAEALFVVDEALFVVTKGRNAPVRVYRFPALRSGRTVSLALVAELTADEPGDAGRITDAATSPDGQWLALRSTEQILFYDAQSMLSGKPEAVRAHDLRRLAEPQGEGITWADATTLYLAGESDTGATFARLSCTLPH